MLGRPPSVMKEYLVWPNIYLKEEPYTEWLLPSQHQYSKFLVFTGIQVSRSKFNLLVEKNWKVMFLHIELVTIDFKPNIPALKECLVYESNTQFLLLFLTLTQCQCSRHCTEHWMRHNSLFTWLMGKTRKHNTQRDSVMGGRDICTMRNVSYLGSINKSHEIVRGDCYMGRKLGTHKSLIKHLEHSA